MSDSYIAWKQWDASGFARFSRSESRYFEWCSGRELADRPTARVLEIGFGNGNFLGFARRRGWKVIGLEVNEELIQRARSLDFHVIGKLEELDPDLQLDMVVAFDVLEHLPISNASGLLEGLRRHLAPGASLLIRVPNGDSPFGRVYQHGDRTHVETYGSEKLRQLADAAGMEMTLLGEVPWHVEPGHGRNVRNFVRGLLRGALSRLIRFAYFGAKLDLSPNLLVRFRPKAISI